jgi:CRISPR-associated protein Cas1
MVNEFVYCPRLFFYEWVEGLFCHSADTIEGRFNHRRVDSKADALPDPEELTCEEIHSRSVTLSSERLKVIAKIDLVEVADGFVTPVDYKNGRPREVEGGLELWSADEAQLAVQGLILRENGYSCEEGIAYYAKTRQRVRVEFSESVLVKTERAIRDAWAVAASGVLPAPLEDSPKCPRCSLVGICLPDEPNSLRTREERDERQLLLFGEAPSRKPPASEPRGLITPRDELRPVYLNTQGARVGKSGSVLQIRYKDQLLQEALIGEICQVNLMGNVQVSTQAIQTLCEAQIPICYFSQGGWFYGITSGLNTKNVFLRRSQYRLADHELFALSLTRSIVAGKIRNQRTMLQRNHIEPRPEWLASL